MTEREEITQQLHKLSAQRSYLMTKLNSEIINYAGLGKLNSEIIKYARLGMIMDILNHERDLLDLVHFCQTGVYPK